MKLKIVLGTSTSILKLKYKQEHTSSFSSFNISNDPSVLNVLDPLFNSLLHSHKFYDNIVFRCSTPYLTVVLINWLQESSREMHYLYMKMKINFDFFKSFKSPLWICYSFYPPPVIEDFFLANRDILLF